MQFARYRNKVSIKKYVPNRIIWVKMKEAGDVPAPSSAHPIARI